MRLARVALVGTLCLGAQVAWAQAEVTQDIPGHGKINYSEKTITATGSGAPSLKAKNVAVARLGAERAAKMDALRNILEAVKGATISGTTTASKAMSASPQVKARVEGIVRNFKVLDTKYYSDGGVDLIVQVPLSGITDAIVADAGSKAPPASAAGGVTGIIINAKGLSVAPALAPRILDDKGQEIYAATHVTKDAIREHGVCGYTKSLDAAMKDKRVSDKPLVIKAVRLPETGSADLVISGDDAGKVAKLGSLLAKAKVIIVTD